MQEGSLPKCYKLDNGSSFSFFIEEGIPYTAITHTPSSEEAVHFRPRKLDSQLHIILNKAAGHGKGPQVLATCIEPLLALLSIKYLVHETKCENDGTRVGREISEAAAGKSLDVCVIAGDGTLHEILQGFPAVHLPSINFVLMPFGTANALFHSSFSSQRHTSPADYSLQSLLRFLSSDTKPKPLPLANVSSPSFSAIGHVVVSSALHASILYDSEKLRASIPGLERFKQAAEMNWTKEYSGSLRLLGPLLQQYSPEKRRFVSIDAEELRQEGNWIYCNGCLTDRLEELLVVAPQRHQGPDTASTIDVITVQRPSSLEKETFFANLMSVFGGMYDGGKHINAVWSKDGELRQWQEGDDVDALAVRYWRCSGFEWSGTTSDDERSRLVCIDGSIKELEEGETCTVKMLQASPIGLWA